MHFLIIYWFSVSYLPKTTQCNNQVYRLPTNQNPYHTKLWELTQHSSTHPLAWWCSPPFQKESCQVSVVLDLNTYTGAQLTIFSSDVRILLVITTWLGGHIQCNDGTPPPLTNPHMPPPFSVHACHLWWWQFHFPIVRGEPTGSPLEGTPNHRGRCGSTQGSLELWKREGKALR